MENSTPKYSSESFIPILVGENKDSNQTGNERHRKKEKKMSYNSPSVIPWKIRQSYSCGVIGLHEEINDFYEKMRPTQQETEIRLRVVESITKIVHSLWPYAEVEVFGSFRTGLYLPSSDIDIVVIGGWRSLPLSTLSNALGQIGISDDDLIIIANASVPIIRLTHPLSNIKVDISFNMKNGIDSAKMVKKLMKKYPVLSKLVLVLKQFLLQRGLNEVYNGGMSSYCLTLLIVSLLQGYHKPYKQPSTNLGTLLLEFFEHYGLNFNYEKVVINFFEGGNYQPNREHRRFNKRGRQGIRLNVQDPFISGRNIAQGTFLMNQLQQAFQNAFYLLHKAVVDSAASKQPLDSYLSLIVKVDDSVWEERESLKCNYSLIMKELSHRIENITNIKEGFRTHDNEPSSSSYGNNQSNRNR